MRTYRVLCSRPARLAGGAARTLTCLGDTFSIFHTQARKGTSTACEPFYLFSPLKLFQADFGLDCWLTFFLIAINATNISHGALEVIGRRDIKKQNKPKPNCNLKHI